MSIFPAKEQYCSCPEGLPIKLWLYQTDAGKAMLAWVKTQNELIIMNKYYDTIRKVLFPSIIINPEGVFFCNWIYNKPKL